MELEWKRAMRKRRPLILSGEARSKRRTNERAPFCLSGASDAQTLLFHFTLGNVGDAESNALGVACPTNGRKRSKHVPLLPIESQQNRSANNTDIRLSERAPATRGYFKYILMQSSRHQPSNVISPFGKYLSKDARAEI